MHDGRAGNVPKLYCQGQQVADKRAEATSEAQEDISPESEHPKE
jgi:hypothetical protein